MLHVITTILWTIGTEEITTTEMDNDKALRERDTQTLHDGGTANI